MRRTFTLFLVFFLSPFASFSQVGEGVGGGAVFFSNCEVLVESYPEQQSEGEFLVGPLTFEVAESSGRRRGVDRPTLCQSGFHPVFIVNVALLYDVSAIPAVGSNGEVKRLLAQFLEEAELAFERSLINVRFQPVFIGLAPESFRSSGNISDDIWRIRNNLDIQNLRNIYKADIVGFWSGWRKAGTPVGSAFTYLRSSCGFFGGVILPGKSDPWVFLHEIGHPFGMGHNPESNPEYKYTEYGMFASGHWIDGVFATAMTYASVCPSGCPLIRYYSNPDVYYLGFPTGVPEDRDNSRVGRIAGPIVSGYRGDGPEFVCVEDETPEP